MNAVLSRRLKVLMQTQADCYKSLTLPENVGSESKIAAFARTTAGIECLRETIQNHAGAGDVDSLKLLAEAYLLLSTSSTLDVAENLRNGSKALDITARLVDRIHMHGAGETEELQELMQLHTATLQYARICERQSRDLMSTTSASSREPNRQRDVDRRGNDLTYDEFMREYASKRRPVIFRAGTELGRVSDVVLDFATLEQHIGGGSLLPLQTPRPQSMNWARMESATMMRGDEFLRSIQSNVPSALYLFDWPLPLSAPELAELVHVPAFAQGDVLPRIASTYEHMYTRSWPSLFVAQAGVSSGTHIDGFGRCGDVLARVLMRGLGCSHFWMHLYKGTKRWTFYDAADTHRLYPRASAISSTLTFDCDLMKLEERSRWPLVNVSIVAWRFVVL
jgi:hypothetical protein